MRFIFSRPRVKELFWAGGKDPQGRQLGSDDCQELHPAPKSGRSSAARITIGRVVAYHLTACVLAAPLPVRAVSVDD